MNRFLYLSIFLIIGFSSCNPKIDFSKIIPTNIDKFATEFMIETHKGNIDSCYSLMSNELKNGLGRQKLIKSYSFIHEYSIDSFSLINARKMELYGDDGFVDYWVEYEYILTDKYLYSSLGIREQNGNLIVMSFDGMLTDDSLLKVHSFTLKDKGFIHYLFLIFTVFIPIFIITTLVFVIRAKLKRKWLWIIGVLFGFIKFSINWTTGQFGFSLINISILGAGFSKSGNIAPWVLSFSLPIVAILFWYKKYLNKKEDKVQNQLDEKIIIEEYKEKFE